MVGELAVVEPLAPEVDCPLDAVVRLVVVPGRGVLGPRKGDKCGLTSLEDRARTGATAFEAQAQVGDEPQLKVNALAGADRLVVAVTGVLPPAVDRAVVEHRLAVQMQLDGA